jgi:hypothetical protein
MAVGRKLYYAPGVISLLGFIFILPYAHNKSAPRPVYSIPLYAIEKGADKEQFLPNTGWLLNHIKNKKKLNFLLTGDHLTNQKKIETIRYEARRLKYTLDRSTVIVIAFTEDLYYADFVRLLDICLVDSLKRYATWDKYFVILEQLPIRRKSRYEYDGVLVCCDVYPIYKKLPHRSLLTKAGEVVWPFTLGQIAALTALWLLMIFLSFYKRRRIPAAITTTETPSHNPRPFFGEKQ